MAFKLGVPPSSRPSEEMGAKLDDLPPEILLLIFESLDRPRDVLSLSRVGSKFQIPNLKKLLCEAAKYHGRDRLHILPKYIIGTILAGDVHAFKALAPFALMKQPTTDVRLRSVAKTYGVTDTDPFRFRMEEGRAHPFQVLCALCDKAPHAKEMLIWALEKRLSLPLKDGRDFDEIIMAMQTDNLGLLRILLRHDVRLRENVPRFETGLYDFLTSSISGRRLDMVKCLFEVEPLRMVSIIRQRENDGLFGLYQYLHRHSVLADAEILEFLLSRYVPNIGTLQTLLSYVDTQEPKAAEIIRLLLQYGARPDINYLRGAVRRVGSDKRWFRDAILPYFTTLSPGDRYNLLEVAMVHEEYMEMLLKAFPDILKGGLPNDVPVLDAFYVENSLGIGSFRRHGEDRQEVALKLLEWCDRNMDEGTIRMTVKGLNRAARCGHTDVLRAVLPRFFGPADGSNHKIELTQMDKDRLLYDTIDFRRGSGSSANFLIQQGCNPNVFFGIFTPIMRACLLGMDDILEVLINAGADVNANVEPYEGGYRVKPETKSALEIAAIEVPNARRVAVLLRAGAIVHDRPDNASFIKAMLRPKKNKSRLKTVRWYKPNERHHAARAILKVRPELAHELMPGKHEHDMDIISSMQEENRRRPGNAVSLVVDRLLNEVAIRGDPRFRFLIASILLGIDGITLQDVGLNYEDSGELFESGFMLLLKDLVFEHGVDPSIRDLTRRTPLEKVMTHGGRCSQEKWHGLFRRLERNQVTYRATMRSPREIFVNWVREIPM
ncbi:hypothetical protein KEM54_005529 [Ascosphaera aggregata]|nr:hypothetical protein KEM54_005529 [Ascosphaera aggregata]